MWCTDCQQDVRATLGQDGRQFSCPRCFSPLGGTSPADGRRQADPEPNCAVQSPPDQAPPDVYDAWEAEERLRHIERLLAIDRSQGSGAREVPAGERLQIRIDNAHLPAASHRRLQQSRQRPGEVKPPGDWLSVVTWTVLSLAMTVLVCGGVLLGTSILTGRESLWSVGAPIALVGQILLLVGLVLQIDRLWHDNRHTVAKLEEVDDQIDDLRHSTSLLNTTHGSHGTSFYTHFAGGASAEILLADLKSQLDLLAAKLDQQQ